MAEKNPDLIYLAGPYSHPKREVREDRFFRLNVIAAWLMERGFHVFSPISHTHPIAIINHLPSEFKFWEQYDLLMLQHCTKLAVAQIPGWDQSEGVRREIELAAQIGIERIDIPPLQIHQIFKEHAWRTEIGNHTY